MAIQETDLNAHATDERLDPVVILLDGSNLSRSLDELLDETEEDRNDNGRLLQLGKR